MTPKITRPAKRLKPFFWNKLNAPTLPSTVWGEIPTDVPFNLDDLESTFAIETTSSTSSQVSVTSPKKQNVTTMLDITRANNIGERRCRNE